jgi:hypothetical protein
MPTPFPESCASPGCPDGTTDRTTDETTGGTTSHLTRLSKNDIQVIDETNSHLTKAASCQVIGYGYSHSAMPPKNGGQAAGYSHLTDKTTDITISHLTNPASEKLLDGHPKDAGQVIDEITSHLTKAASCQVIGYGYSHSTRLSAEELLAGHPKGFA